MRQSRRAQRGLTLMEVTISLSVLAIVMTVFMSLLETSGETSNLVHTQTSAQLRAESALRILRDELRHTGVGGGSDLELDLAPAAPGAVWEIRYNKLESGGPLFDPTAQDPYATLPWSTDRFALRFERVDDVANGVDDDGDLLIDEGRVALYRLPAGGPAELVSVLALDIADVRVEQQFDVRPRLHLEVDAERVLRTAINGPEDLAATRAGGGPRLRHTADIWLTLPN